MSILDDLINESMIQDAFGIFDNTEKELLNKTLQEEWLSTDNDECEQFASKGLHGRCGDY